MTAMRDLFCLRKTGTGDGHNPDKQEQELHILGLYQKVTIFSTKTVLRVPADHADMVAD